MAEIELKFQIPQSIRHQFEQDFQQYGPTRHHLCAKYFDTADQQLQQHKIALRQRLEDQQWFQTLKHRASINLNALSWKKDWIPHRTTVI